MFHLLLHDHMASEKQVIRHFRNIFMNMTSIGELNLPFHRSLADCFLDLKDYLLTSSGSKMFN